MSFYVNNIVIPDPSTLGVSAILLAFEIRKTIAPFTLFQGDLATPVAGLVVYSGSTLNDRRNAVLTKLEEMGLISFAWPAWDGDTTNLIPNGIPQVYSIDPAFVAPDQISIATDQTQPISYPGDPGIVPPDEQYTLTIQLYDAASAPVPFYAALQAWIDNEEGLELLSTMFKPVE